jgi:hypothetical protein
MEARTEYPALLVRLQDTRLHVWTVADMLRQASLTPDQAVSVFNDRLSLINKVNSDIADWLQVSTAQWRKRCVK